MKATNLIHRVQISAVISLVAYNPVLPFFVPTAGAIAAPIAPIEMIFVTDAPQAFASGDTVTVSGVTELNTLVRVVMGEQSIMPAADGQGAWMASFQRVPAGKQLVEITTRSIVGVKTITEPLFVTVELSRERTSNLSDSLMNAPIAPLPEHIEGPQHGRQFHANKEGNGTDHLFQSQHKASSHSPIDAHKKKHAHKRLTHLPIK